MQPKRTWKNRLVTRARVVFFGLFALAVLLLVIVGTYTFRVISDDFSKRLSRQYSIEAAANFLSTTSQHFMLAHQLAHSTSVSRWVADIDNAEFMAEALDRIESYASYAPHISLRVSFDESFYTYYLGTGFTVAEFDFDRSVMGEGPGREWFIDTRDAELPFNLNIQRSRGRYEEYNIYVWTNHRIYYEDRFVGVMTAGSPFSYVFDTMFGDFDADIQRGYIIDNVGMVRVDSAGRLQLFDEGWSMPAPAPEAADNPEMVQVLDTHLERMQGGAFPPGTEVLDAISIQGDYRYASIAPIIGTNWSVAVLSGDTGIWGEQYVIIAAAVFIALAGFVLISNYLLRKILVTPLHNLTQSTANIGTDNDTQLYGLERDDEIGDLARTIKQSQEAILVARDLREQVEMLSKLKHQEELLSATNRAAEILLTSVSGEDSLSAIDKGMEIVAESIDADLVLLWRNETIDDELSFVLRNKWTRLSDDQDDGPNIGDSYPYSDWPGWYEMFSRGDVINSAISKLPKEFAKFLGAFGVKSVVIIPLFVGGEFFGRVSVSDRRRERVFSEMEVDIIRSASMMFVNAYNIVEHKAEIRETAEKAKQANNAKSRFLARMSHEMRTPMNAVMGISEIQLQKGLHPTDTEDAFLRIHHSSNLLLSLINDILNLSQIEAGKTEIIQKEYETADMIVETIQLNMIHIGSKPIDFKLSIDENIPRYLEGDELRIKQVMNNILSNAFKYTEKGMVALSLRREDSSQENMITLVIEVADTGQGISKAKLKTLFEREFNRLNIHMNSDIEGTGLGMTIASELVDLMGGIISVESTLGKGSAFTVRIPQKIASDEILGDSAGRLQNYESIEILRKKISMVDFEQMSGRVLVVDDVETNRYVARGLLAPYKLNVETASSGREALKMIENGNTYDIIFMDHMMPGMDGIETAKHIRKTGYTLPIIALTANTLDGQKEMFLNNGFNDFISKPIVVDKLDKCLKEFIRGKRQATDSEPIGADKLDKDPKEVITDKRQASSVTETSISPALIEYFLRDADKAAKELNEIISSDNFSDENIKRFILNAHSAKSALYNIGENDLAEVGGALEIAGNANNIEKIRTDTPTFLKSLAEVMEKLK